VHEAKPTVAMLAYRVSAAAKPSGSNFPSYP